MKSRSPSNTILPTHEHFDPGLGTQVLSSYPPKIGLLARLQLALASLPCQSTPLGNACRAQSVDRASHAE